MDIKIFLALDIGTTNVKSFLYTANGDQLYSTSVRIEILKPERGASEINPDDLWENIDKVVGEAVKYAENQKWEIDSMGVSTQRGTGTFWESKSGKVLNNFVSWQDIRCKKFSDEINGAFATKLIRHASSVLYFVTRIRKFLAASVIKFREGMACVRLAWLMEILDCKERCQNGEVVWGNIDSWLLRKMNDTEYDGVHKCEITQATGYGCYDPFELEWSSVVCNLLGIPMKALPKVFPTTSKHFGRFQKYGIPIKAICGDANAAMIGEGMTRCGDMKITMGTGGFVDLNTGSSPFPSSTGAYPLVGWQLEGGNVTYLAEVDDTACGVTIDWGQQMGFYDSPEESEKIAESVSSTAGVVFIPALCGFGAPINDPTASAGFLGIKSDITKAHLARSILQGISFRIYQLTQTLYSETGISKSEVTIDGGVSQNNFICQRISSLMQQRIVRRKDPEASARGVVFLAAIAINLYTLDTLPDMISESILPNRHKADQREYRKWLNSIRLTQNFRTDI